MLVFVKIVGIIITTMGILIFLDPKIAKRMMAFWQQGFRYIVLGAQLYNY